MVFVPLLLLGLGASPLDDFLAKLTTAYTNPAEFRTLAGPTPFDGVPGNQRSSFGKPRVVFQSSDGKRAVVLLSGAQILDNSGDQTWTSSTWSGLYEIQQEKGSWALGKQIPRSVNRLDAHDLEVDLDPKVGLAVRDRLTIRVNSEYGFSVMLNKNAQVRAVTLDAKPVEYDFQNGLLWLPSAKGDRKLFVDYTIKVERPENGGNSSAFGDEAGHVRNQYFWHPVLDFGEENGLAKFRIRATVPAKFQLALDVPQQERVQNEVRVVEGETPMATTALSLAYDDAWIPRDLPTRGIRMRLFATKSFSPSDEIIADATTRMVEVLTRRFGKPAEDSIKIVQARRRGGNGWFFLSNQAIFAGANGREPLRAKAYPINVFIGHEVAHLWTRPTGPLRFVLMEGWATYAESLVIREQFGEDAERQFWRDDARKVTSIDEIMAMAIRDDANNNGLSYWKGSWVFKMVEALVGSPAFDQAMTRYIQQPLGKTSFEDFLTCFGGKRAEVERFVEPWINERGLPKIDVRSTAESLVFTQVGPLYWLPNLTLRLTLGDGSMEYAKVDLKGRETLLKLRGKKVASVEIDPVEAYMLERRLYRLSSGE